MDEKRKYAMMAALSYEPQDKFMEYKLDKSHSSDEMLCYVSPMEVVVSIRGSTTLTDWVVTDVAILLQKIERTPRWKRTKQEFTSISNKYSSKLPIKLVGHSLGGTLCLLLLKHYGSNIKHVYIYNAGIGIRELKSIIANNLLCKLSKKSKKCYLKKLTFVRTKFDPASLLGSVFSETHEQKPDQNVHTIQNFTKTMEIDEPDTEHNQSLIEEMGGSYKIPYKLYQNYNNRTANYEIFRPQGLLKW